MSGLPSGAGGTTTGWEGGLGAPTTITPFRGLVGRGGAGATSARGGRPAVASGAGSGGTGTFGSTDRTFGSTPLASRRTDCRDPPQGRQYRDHRPSQTSISITPGFSRHREQAEASVDLRFFSPAQVVIPPRPIVSHTCPDAYDPCLDNIDSLYRDLPNRKRRIDSLSAGKKARIERNIAIQDSVEALNTKQNGTDSWF